MNQFWLGFIKLPDLLIIFFSNLDSMTVNRNPTIDEAVTNTKYVDNELDKTTSLWFNQSLQNYLKVSVGDIVYNVTKLVEKTKYRHNNIQLSKQRRYVLQQMEAVGKNVKVIKGKNNFLRIIENKYTNRKQRQ